MGNETILEKIKNIIYKIILPVFLWSIGFKTIKQYAENLKKEYFYFDLENLFLIPYEHGIRKAVINNVESDEHGYILSDTFPCYDEKELERFAYAINTENITHHIKLNEPQIDTLKRIKALAKTSHFIDLKFRDNGKDKIEQADFLREILKRL